MKKRTWWWWPASLALAFVLGAALGGVPFAWAQAGPGFKLGVVNVDKVARDSKVGKTKFVALEAEAKLKSDELEKERLEIERLKKEFDEKQMIWSEETRRQKKNDFELKARSFERKFVDYRDALQKREMEALEPMEKSLSEVIEKMGTEQKYSLILDLRGQLIFYDPKLLITDEVTRYFDAHGN